MRGLVIDEDPYEAQFISLILGYVGIETDRCNSSENALKLLRQRRYCVVFLDLMSPDIGGYEILRRMRAVRDDTPVLLLSDHFSTRLNLKTFRVGVDDYLVKPLDRDEVVVRTQVAIKRRQSITTPDLRVGPLTLNLDSREVRVSEKTIDLTNKEYAILEFLVRRKGMVLTKQALMDHLYGGGDAPEVKIIDVFVCKLRKKLAQVGVGHLIGNCSPPIA
jgi:two-component system cell cycle response regulator CtrA